ncbi:MAG: Decaprenyl-phosphate phosphoribosyltransferase [Candidatus Lokiarchaeum sp. GC14_75]|nr:MAG: Decaprenyl-phosphate phosphoribosyltransferase [Candidatus Lokiarchaeum sp. GC14_75]
MLNRIKELLHLLRVRQYYKNIMIFVGIFFSQNLFDPTHYISLIIGFILLCFTSSFNYIINDIGDIEKDKLHTEKLKKKPLASGSISKFYAIIILIILALLIIASSIFLLPNLGFIFMIVLMILTGQLYNHIFKKYAFIDIIILSTGYLWRALAGCMIIEQYVSAWLFLAIFEVAIFLSIAKRKGDLKFLGEDVAAEHKEVYDQYSLKLLDQFHVIIAGSLFMTYALYLINTFGLVETAETGIPTLFEYLSILTVPISLYILMRYMYLTSSKPEIARSTEKAFFDKGMIIAGVLLGGILLFSFYY